MSDTMNAEEQIRHDIEADRDRSKSEWVDIFGSPLRERTDRQRILDYANRFRESLGDLTFDQALLFGDLTNALDEMPATIEPAAPAAATPSASAPDGPDPVTVPLHWPVLVSGLRTDRLTLRPPRFADVEAVEKGEIAEIDMHARMADVSTDTLRQMRWSDVEVFTTLARHLAPAMRRR